MKWTLINEVEKEKDGEEEGGQGEANRAIGKANKLLINLSTYCYLSKKKNKFVVPIMMVNRLFQMRQTK